MDLVDEKLQHMKVTHSRTQNNLSFDFITGVLKPIEVKTAHATFEVRGGKVYVKYQFKVSRPQKEVCEVLVLVLKTPESDILFYVLPMRDVPFTPHQRYRKIAFNPHSKRKSKYDIYKDCWELVLPHAMQLLKALEEITLLRELTARITAGECQMVRKVQKDETDILTLVRANIERVKAFRKFIRAVRNWHDTSAEELDVLSRMQGKREFYLWNLYKAHQRDLPEMEKALIRKVLQERFRTGFEKKTDAKTGKKRGRKRRS